MIYLTSRSASKIYFFNPGNIALLMLLVWVVFRFLAFTEYPDLEYGEFVSLWMRSFLAVLTGTMFGSILGRKVKGGLLTLIGICIILLAEYYLGIFSKIELSNAIYDGLFKSKAAVSYFLLFPYLISCSYIYFLLARSKKIVFQSVIFLGLSILVLSLSLFGFYFSKSLNGLLIAAVCSLPLLLKILVDIFYQKEKRGLKITLAVVLISSILSLLSFYSKHDSKLTNIIEDAYLGTQIDIYPNWHNDADKPWVPNAPDGHLVNQSTYYRVANMFNGIRFVKEQPLGLGFTYLPYGYLMKQKYPLSQADHTHSGWVDFALGQGIPGLMLMWLAMVNTLMLGIKSTKNSDPRNSFNQVWGYSTVWVIGGIFAAWIVNEVSEREYIEQLFFIIALFAASNTPTNRP